MSAETRILVIHSSPDTPRRIASALAATPGSAFSEAAIESAETLEKALKMTNGHQPAAIITSTELADSTGVATIRSIRREFPAAPIIVLVEDEDHASGAEALRNGAQDYLFASEARGDVIERSIRRAVERCRVDHSLADASWKSGIGETALPAAANPRPSAPSASDTAARTILLVDDEESVRAIITKILGRAGHQVLEAVHGQGALRLAAAYDGPIDLLITDMYMPGLRGPEIVERLRQTRPGIHVLFMSGFTDEDVARSGLDPALSFLRKPFTIQELTEAVQSALTEQTPP